MSRSPHDGNKMAEGLGSRRGQSVCHVSRDVRSYQSIHDSVNINLDAISLLCLGRLEMPYGQVSSE